MTKTREIMKPSNEEDVEDAEDEDEPHLRQYINKQQGNKGKQEVVDSGIKVVRLYSTIQSEKKLLVNAKKANKSLTTNRRKLKKVVVVEEEKNIEVVEVREDENIHPNIDVVIDKKRKYVHVLGRTRSSH